MSASFPQILQVLVSFCFFCTSPEGACTSIHWQDTVISASLPHFSHVQTSTLSAIKTPLPPPTPTEPGAMSGNVFNKQAPRIFRGTHFPAASGTGPEGSGNLWGTVLDLRSLGMKIDRVKVEKITRKSSLCSKIKTRAFTT